MVLVKEDVRNLSRLVVRVFSSTGNEDTNKPTEVQSIELRDQSWTLTTIFIILISKLSTLLYFGDTTDWKPETVSLSV